MTGQTGSPNTVIVAAGAVGAQLEVEQLGVDVALTRCDAVMIEGVTTPLRGTVTPPWFGCEGRA